MISIIVIYIFMMCFLILMSLIGLSDKDRDYRSETENRILFALLLISPIWPILIPFLLFKLGRKIIDLVSGFNILTSLKELFGQLTK